MTNSQRLTIRASEIRQRLNEIAGMSRDDLTDDIRSESNTLRTELADTETQLRAAIASEGEDERQRANDPGSVQLTAEEREREALRTRANFTGYIRAAMGNGRIDGAEAEYLAAAGLGADASSLLPGVTVPLALFEPPLAERRQRRERADAPTAAPATVGVNLQPIRPFVFAAAVLPRLGVEMPGIESGTYVESRISTALSASAKGKGDAAMATAAQFAPASSTPKRISARLSVRIEDVAAAGVANFESALRQNLQMALSAEVDNQGLNGDGQGDNLNGLLKRLTDAAAPGAVTGFDDFVSSVADLVDGLWADTMRQVSLVVGPATYAKSAKTFRDRVIDEANRGGVSLGDTSFADYAAEHTAGWFTNSRMPDADGGNVQKAIAARLGQPGIRRAVCPHWQGMSLTIDDPYTGSAKGERYVTSHVLLGDVIVVQPGAYQEVAFKLA